MEIRERKFDAILLDVDGTLLDFGMSERQGMKVTAVRRRNCTAGSWMHPHF